MNQIVQCIESLITGLVCGVVFSLINLPIPAPTVVAGIVGIIGIFLGFYMVQLIK